MSNKVLPNVSVTLSIQSENEGEKITFGPCTTCSWREACKRTLEYYRPEDNELYVMGGNLKGCTNWTDDPKVWEDYRMTEREVKELETNLQKIKEFCGVLKEDPEVPPVKQTTKAPYVELGVYQIKADGSLNFLSVEQFEKDVVKIGRGSAANLRITNDSAVALMHCYLQLHKDKAVVSDVVSKIGTRVNGTRVDKKEIVVGDKIVIGNTSLFVRVLNLKNY